MPTTRVTLPATVIAAVPAIVPVKPVQLIDKAPVLPVAIVTVPVDATSKKTASAVVGTDAPPAPPDVVAHFVPAVPSQDAVPPTQYLSAILWRLLHSRRHDHRNPVINPLLLQALNLFIRRHLIFREIQRITVCAMLRFLLKNNLNGVHTTPRG